MKKINILFLLPRGALGGTERSAIIYAQYLVKKKYNPIFGILTPIDKAFKDRLGDLPYEIIDKEKILDFIKNKKIDLLFDTTGQDAKSMQEINKYCSVISSVNFLETYIPERNGNLFISKTEHLKANILYQGVKNDFVLFLPVDIKKWTALDKDPKIKPFVEDDGRIVIGRIGRATPSKWHYLILATLSKFKKEGLFKKFRFIFVGMPWIYRLYLKLFLKKQLNDGSIILLPELVSDTDLARFYKSLDLFFQTAWVGESFGCVIAESFSSKVPAITDHKGFLRKDGSVASQKYDTQIELVDNNSNGLYSNHPTTIFESLKGITKKDLEKMGAKAYAKARDNYSAELVTKRLQEIIDAFVEKDESKIKKLMVTKKEYADYKKEYLARIHEARAKESLVPACKMVRYNIACGVWRGIEYAYLALNKIMLKLGINLEKKRD